MLLRELEASKAREEENRTLVAAVNEIQKRCVKHQKGEIEAKKELAGEKQLVVRRIRSISFRSV